MINVQFINNVELLIFLFGSICVTKPKYSHNTIAYYWEKFILSYRFEENRIAMNKKTNKSN